MSENELPSGWVAVTLADITEINPKWWSDGPSDDTPVSFIPMAAVEEENGRIDLKGIKEWRAVSKGYTRFEEGDVIFAKITPCMENGKSAVARGLEGGRATGSTEFHVLRPTSAISADLLRYFLVQSDVRNRARMYMKGAAGQLRVSPEYLRALKFLLPPRSEQDRIVSEIETLLTDLDAAVAALKRVQANLKRYRASVLKAACEGRLVPTEAELARKEGRSYESGEQLLQRILKERRAKWETDQLAKMHDSGKSPENNEWKKKYKDPAPPVTTDMPDLPEGWTWASLDQVFAVERGRFSVRPRNDPRYFNGPYPFVQIGDLPRDGGRIEKFHQTVNEDGLAVSKMFRRGTVLIAIVGATIANTGALSFDSCCPDSLVALQSENHALLQYGEAYMQSIKLELRRMSYASGGQPNINLGMLNPYPFPLPPAAEQARIVEELERRSSSIDVADVSVRTTTKRAGRLRQAILKRAFEGKLVPQDPNDEPASVLLEHIHAERAMSGVSSRSGRNTVAHGVSRGKGSRSKAASPGGA